MEDFKIEPKYMVASLKDARLLSEQDYNDLSRILSRLSDIRINKRNKPRIEAMVIDKNALGENAFTEAVEIVKRNI